MLIHASQDLGRVVVVGGLAYLWLILVLRVSGKRTLAQSNAFDFIVTVALGSTLATALLSPEVSLAEAALALALLAVLQLAVAWFSVRSSRFRSAITAEPSLLVWDGEPQTDTMLRQRVSRPILDAAVRNKGYGSLDLVGAVVLETDGTMSVISKDRLGSGSSVSELR